MRFHVIVPFVPDKIHPAVDDALRQQLCWPDYVDVTDRGYFGALKDQWERAQTDGMGLIVIEHDILPWPGALVEAATCRRQWCALPYFILGRLNYALGFAKFSDRVIRDSQVIWAEGYVERWMERSGSDTDPRIQWGKTDMYVQSCLRHLHFRRHEHETPVLHMNEVHWPHGARADVGRRGGDE